jgi:hypothetical protein
MFATINDVKDITGKIVNAELVSRAQYAIEAYVGKIENDITKEKDIEIMRRAVAYQSAYMLNNEDIVFEQMAVSTTGQSDSYTTFKPGDTTSPFISPMSVMMCSQLSFIKVRSIKTGKILKNSSSFYGWREV